jgi:hypothetical protein
MGAVVNIAIAFLISKVKVQYLVVISAVVSAIAPILMATVRIDENYWFAPFWALFLSPVNPDGRPSLFSSCICVPAARYWLMMSGPAVLFTVSNLVISDAFPADLQSLAGGIFNVIAQFGNSVGLAVTAAIASSVTEHSSNPNHEAALMEGYRAAFWTIFTSCTCVLLISYFGLRNGGTIGQKEKEDNGRD